MPNAADWIATIVEIVVILPVYFVPSFVATSRKHRNGAAIFMLNLLLGWTCLAWIAALVWACTNNTEDLT